MSSPTQRFNVTAARKYTTSSGEEKKQWITIGEATDWSDGSRSMRLDVVPTGSWFDGRLYLFPRDDDRANGGGRGQQRQSRAEPQPQRQAPVQTASGFDDGFGDDIPFN